MEIDNISDYNKRKYVDYELDCNRIYKKLRIFGNFNHQYEYEPPRKHTTASLEKYSEDMTSIHAGNISEVYEMPMSAIIRPFQPEYDEKKVKSIMKTLSNPQTIDQVPPIDIIWITGTEGGNYYYSFGGCHRYIAHKNLKSDTIKVKLVKSNIADLKCYLGGSTPDLK